MTLLRVDGSATYQLAIGRRRSRARDHARDPRLRPSAERGGAARIARALGGELPEVIHHGLLLGEDGKKLSKREGHGSVADAA